MNELHTITRDESDQILSTACWELIRNLSGRVTPKVIKDAAHALAARMGDDSPKAVGLALSLAFEALTEIERATAAEETGK